MDLKSHICMSGTNFQDHIIIFFPYTSARAPIDYFSRQLTIIHRTKCFFSWDEMFFRRTKFLFVEQNVFYRNKMFFIKTKCFSLEQNVFY